MYRDPLPNETETSTFNAIWECIKTWDINVPEKYEGYTGATGNHVCAIIDALNDIKEENSNSSPPGPPTQQGSEPAEIRAKIDDLETAFKDEDWVAVANIFADLRELLPC